MVALVVLADVEVGPFWKLDGVELFVFFIGVWGVLPF